MNSILGKVKNMKNNNSIKLNDILKLDEKDFETAKVRFNQWNGSQNPMENYMSVLLQVIMECY